MSVIPTRLRSKTKSVGTLGLVAVITAVCLFPVSASAQTVVNDNWLGGTGNWSNPSALTEFIPEGNRVGMETRHLNVTFSELE